MAKCDCEHCSAARDCLAKLDALLEPLDAAQKQNVKLTTDVAWLKDRENRERLSREAAQRRVSALELQLEAARSALEFYAAEPYLTLDKGVRAKNALREMGIQFIGSVPA